MMRGSTPPSSSRPGGVRLNIDKVLVKQNRNSNQKQATQTRPGRDVQDAELQRVMEASKLVDGCLLRPREKLDAAAVEDAASSWARIDGLSPRMSTVGQAESLIAQCTSSRTVAERKIHRAPRNFNSRSCCAATNVSGAKKVPPLPGPNEWQAGLPTEPVGSAAGGALVSGEDPVRPVWCAQLYSGLCAPLAHCPVSFSPGFCWT